MASLQNSDSSNTLEPVATLRSSEDTLAIDALLKALDSRTKAVRDTAIASLRRLDAGPVLARRLGDSRQAPQSRQQAAMGLRLLKVESTVPALASALSKDSTATVRTEAAFALSMFGAVKAEDALVRALNDGCDDVRYYAADALGSVPSAKVKAALLARQQVEHHMAVQLAIKGALSKIV